MLPMKKVKVFHQKILEKTNKLRYISIISSQMRRYWSGYPIPSPADLPDPGIELGSPTLQVDINWEGHIFF